MKIGIVTIIDNNNYGNRLQNYAVASILKNHFGCKAVTLVPTKQKALCDGNLIAWLKIQILKCSCYFPTLFEERFGIDTIRWSNFVRWNRRIPIRTIYDNETIPKSLNRDFDFFFVGSDQVWNYNFAASRFADYFLKFADDEKKVALSASLGVSTLPREWRKEFSENLSTFAHISVREKEGAAVLEEIIKKQIPILIDPVMVLTVQEWLEVSKRPRIDVNTPYVLKYFLGDESEEEKEIDFWAKNNGYKVYSLLDRDIPELFTAGPSEFISLINNSALVCSDSFHCLAFSILLMKPFIAFPRCGKADNMGSRITTLLETFGFEHRWYSILEARDYLNCDFVYSAKVLDTERRIFFDYVEKALQKN